MDCLTCLEAFHHAEQGICILNCKLENIYINKKAKHVFGTAGSDLSQQIKNSCRHCMTMAKEKATGLFTYSGRLNHRYAVVDFSCLSFYAGKQTFIMVTFDYSASSGSGLAGNVLFTPREKDILQAIAAGKTNKEISEILCIGYETVKSHVRNLLAKTGAGSRTELISKHCHRDDYQTDTANDTKPPKK